MPVNIVDNTGEVFTLLITHNLLTELTLAYYDFLIADQKVCPEQARFVLPQGALVEARVTNSLYGWARFDRQRGDVHHAQRETAHLAEQIKARIAPLLVVSRKWWKFDGSVISG